MHALISTEARQAYGRVIASWEKQGGRDNNRADSKIRQATGNQQAERNPLLDVIVAVELDGRHKERQHAAFDAVLALADVDIKDGAVIAAQACVLATHTLGSCQYPFRLCKREEDANERTGDGGGRDLVGGEELEQRFRLDGDFEQMTRVFDLGDNVWSTAGSLTGVSKAVRCLRVR
jgi:hypothetical protein